jgi:hypothetical protein
LALVCGSAGWLDGWGSAQADDDEHGELEVEGIVAHRAGTCPNIRFVLGNSKIVATDSTWYEDGACADVADGRKVEVHGVTGAHGTVTARKVDLDD